MKYYFSSKPVDDVFKKMIILNVWWESIKISYIGLTNIYCERWDIQIVSGQTIYKNRILTDCPGNQPLF